MMGIEEILCLLVILLAGAYAFGLVIRTRGDWFSFTTSDLTLNELCERSPALFVGGLKHWWKDRPFANRKGKARKLVIRKSAAPGSFGTTWEKQQDVLRHGEFVPTAQELIEGMLAYYKLTGRRLFSDYWVRTVDVTPNGARIYVHFDSDGILIAGWDDRLIAGWWIFRIANFGGAVAREPV